MKLPNPESPSKSQPLYQAVADRLALLIEKGTFQAGDRLPSVRGLGADWSVSVTTVIEAYRQLENRGLIEARPQSGHYVRPRPMRALAEPGMSRPCCDPRSVTLGDYAMRMMHDARDSTMLRLGAAIPNPDLLPMDKLNRTLASVARRLKRRGANYECTAGSRELRIEVARRAMLSGCALSPDDIIITNGCSEAVTLALRAICSPGDTVAVESPTYYGFLHAIEALGLKALEIPTHPREGMWLDALATALGAHPVKCVLAVTNFNNPLGSIMSEEGKRGLVDLCEARGVPLIEDDIYGELFHDGERPKVAASFARTGNVLLCSSVSKTVAPGYRIGWIAPGRLRDRVERLKAVTSISNATLPQLAMAEFLAEGGYDHHLRRVRREYARRVEWMIGAIGRHFPEGTRSTRPTGGFTLWVEMPAGCDSRALYEDARRQRISIAPGPMFSAAGMYGNFVRLNAAFASGAIEEAISTLGQMAGKSVRKAA